MNRANLFAAAPGIVGFLGARGLPEFSAAQWAAVAATFSGLMGGIWFGVQIAFAIEKRIRERRQK